MQACAMRIRVNRHTGEEIGRETLETFDISNDEYAEKLVWALTGKSPDEAARQIRDAIHSETKSA